MDQRLVFVATHVDLVIDQRLRMLAAVKRVSRSEIIREAVQSYLDREGSADVLALPMITISHPESHRVKASDQD